MKVILAILTVALLNVEAYADELNVTFGAGADLAARYGKHDLTGNAKQNADVAAPHISIGGLDLDGLGANNDQIEVKFAVTATAAGGCSLRLGNEPVAAQLALQQGRHSRLLVPNRRLATV
jgi:hypothetical protein